MSLQEMPSFENGLAFLGMFKLMEYPIKRDTAIESVFKENFKDPIGDWDKIKQVFDPFGISKTMDNGSFSKSSEQGDGSGTPFMMAIHNDGVLVQMYNIAKSLDILKDSDAVEITYTADISDPIEIENRTLWKGIALQYEKIKQIEMANILSAYAIAPLVESTSSLNRSPAQIKLYNTQLTDTNITVSEQYGGSSSISVLHKTPWDKVTSLFPSMISVLTEDWWEELYTQSRVKCEYEFIDASLTSISADDVINGYFQFSGSNVLHPIYIIVLPEDSTADISLELKTCYGVSFGKSLLYPCDSCDYAEKCKSPTYIPPSNIDFTIENRIGIGPAVEGDRIRIKYKNAKVA